MKRLFIASTLLFWAALALFGLLAWRTPPAAPVHDTPGRISAAPTHPSSGYRGGRPMPILQASSSAPSPPMDDSTIIADRAEFVDACDC
jgi:hypothetical protein